MLAVAALGDSGVRHPLYEAANMLKRYRGFFSLKTWGMKIAKKHGHKNLRGGSAQAHRHYACDVAGWQ